MTIRVRRGCRIHRRAIITDGADEPGQDDYWPLGDGGHGHVRTRSRNLAQLMPCFLCKRDPHDLAHGRLLRREDATIHPELHKTENPAEVCGESGSVWYEDAEVGAFRLRTLQAGL